MTPPAFVIDISAYWHASGPSMECYHSQFIAGRESSRLRSSIAGVTMPLSGVGRSASTTASPLPAANRSGCPACAPLVAIATQCQRFLPASLADAHFPVLPRRRRPLFAAARISVAPQEIRIPKAGEGLSIVSISSAVPPDVAARWRKPVQRPIYHPSDIVRLAAACP